MALDESNTLGEEPSDEEEGIEDLADEEIIDLDDDEEDLSEDTDDAGLAEEPAAVADDDSEQESLDELLDERLAARSGSDDPDDHEDVLALSSMAVAADTGLTVKVTPMKDRQEFVCNRCHLVKAKVQLADSARCLCRDCV